MTTCAVHHLWLRTAAIRTSERTPSRHTSPGTPSARAAKSEVRERLRSQGRRFQTLIGFNQGPCPAPTCTDPWSLPSLTVMGPHRSYAGRNGSSSRAPSPSEPPISQPTTRPSSLLVEQPRSSSATARATSLATTRTRRAAGALAAIGGRTAAACSYGSSTTRVKLSRRAQGRRAVVMALERVRVTHQCAAATPPS